VAECADHSATWAGHPLVQLKHNVSDQIFNIHTEPQQSFKPWFKLNYRRDFPITETLQILIVTINYYYHYCYYWALTHYWLHAGYLPHWWWREVTFLPASVDIYGYTCLWTTSWHRFKSDCHQTSSFIDLAIGDKVIKFWKVKVSGEVCALLNALLVTHVTGFSWATVKHSYLGECPLNSSVCVCEWMISVDTVPVRWNHHRWLLLLYLSLFLLMKLLLNDCMNSSQMHCITCRLHSHHRLQPSPHSNNKYVRLQDGRISTHANLRPHTVQYCMNGTSLAVLFIVQCAGRLICRPILSF